jgi:3-oxoacyl-[acyl-carrier-protein] synthase II
MVPGSIGAFLVLEAPEHARVRGVKPHANVGAVVSDRSRRKPGDAVASAQRLLQSLAPLIDDRRPLGVLSGASGVEPAMQEEAQFLKELAGESLDIAVRDYGSMLGHGIEAHFLTGIALAALALSKGSFYAPFDGTGRQREIPTGECRQILVTGFGHWRGEALGLLSAIPEGPS